MHVAIIGSHCTGKTTLFNALKKVYPDYVFIDEYIKTLQEMNVPFNETCNDMTQYIASDLCIDALHNENFISDRCLFDVLVYSTYLYKNNVISETCFEEIRNRWFSYNLNYDIFFYARPLQDFVEDNGIRSTDKEFQKGVQEIFEQFLFDKDYDWLFDYKGPKIYKLPEGFEERLIFVKEKIDEFEKRS